MSIDSSVPKGRLRFRPVWSTFAWGLLATVPFLLFACPLLFLPERPSNEDLLLLERLRDVRKGSSIEARVVTGKAELPPESAPLVKDPLRGVEGLAYWASISMHDERGSRSDVEEQPKTLWRGHGSTPFVVVTDGHSWVVPGPVRLSAPGPGGSPKVDLHEWPHWAPKPPEQGRDWVDARSGVLRVGDTVSLLCSASSSGSELVPIAGDGAVPGFVGTHPDWTEAVESALANWRLTRGLGLGLAAVAGLILTIAACAALWPRRE